MYRRELAGDPDHDLPPQLPNGASRDELQQPEDGSGPLFHRVYRAAIAGARLTPAELMARIKADPNVVAPVSLGRFEKTTGEHGAIAPGDEFVVRMPGPWDGPVRAVDVEECSFRFATLSGHLEAGQIEWRAYDRDDRLVFEIESWARAGDRLSALLHDRLKMAKEVQVHMWTSVAEQVVELAGGRLTHGIDIETRRVESEQIGEALSPRAE